MTTFVFTKQPNDPLSIHEFLGTTHTRITMANTRTRWGLLGGTVLFEAKNTSLADAESHSIRIQFHGGRNIWMLEDERNSELVRYPRSDLYGSLQQLMKEFEKRTRLKLPTVRLQEVGIGVSDISANGVKSRQRNPWQLQFGSTYEITRVVDTHGATKTEKFEVLSDDSTGNRRIAFLNDSNTGSETFDPYTIFSGEDWLNLKPIDLGVSLAAARGPAPRAMRNRP